jgi:hypothetical protein
MLIYTQCIFLISLGHLAASQSSQGYLRSRRAKAIKREDPTPAFETVKPLTAEDLMLLTPAVELSTESGITLDASTYTAGDDVEVEFTVLPEYYVNSEVTLNMTNVDDWSVGIFMHMSDPQGGALPPIVSLKPNIEYDRDGTMTGSVTFGSDVVSSMGGSDPAWPLDLIAYGIGFDVWLLDEKGAAIMGPEWFSLEPVEEESTVNGFFEGSDIPMHPLMEHGHANFKQDFEHEQVASALSTFALSTDQPTYLANGTIQVSYTIGEELPPPEEHTDSLILFNPPTIVDQDEPEIKDVDFVSEESFEHQGIFDASFQEADVDFDADFAPQAVDSTPAKPQYSIGVWMKMARPQGGSLEPIISASLDRKSGIVQFDAGKLDTSMYGTGFDLWIVDEEGSEVYGPIFFSIPDPNEEAPVLASY